MTQAPLVVEVDRVLPATPETVFRALTEPTLFAQWMGPDGATTTVEELDVRIGGRLSFVVAMPDGGPHFRLYGYYEEIEPGKRLAHSWMMDGDDSVSTVVFTLEPVGDQTRLGIRHHGLSPEEVAQNDAGWNYQLDRLQTVLVTATR
jgi:uncharacterized protein YndB with AHSA1/START domain